MAINFPASPTTGDTHAASGKNWEFNGTGWVLQVADPAAVTSVNGATGDVVLAATDVGAEPAITTGTTAQYWRGDKSWRDFATDVRSAALAGLSTATSAVIAATDTVLAALGKLQAQITDNLMPSDFIEGLQPFWTSATAVGVRAGAAYIQGSGKVVRAAADLSLSSLALTASAWSHLYVYASSGVLALEASATAPASAYSGTARSKTSDTSRRYVGSVLTDASGNIYKFLQSGSVVMWENSIAGAPFFVLNAGRATTATNVSCSGSVPVTAKVGVLIMATIGAADAAIGNADMSGSLTSSTYLQYVGSGVQTTHLMPLDGSQRFSYLMTASLSSGGFYARVCGYIMER